MTWVISFHFPSVAQIDELTTELEILSMPLGMKSQAIVDSSTE